MKKKISKCINRVTNRNSPIEKIVARIRSKSGTSGTWTAGAIALVLPTVCQGQFSIELSTLTNNPNSDGFTINGIAGNDYSGRSVSDAGDFNGDGFGDLIIGANGANPNGINNAGQSYVIFGTNAPFVSPLELFNLDGTNGFILNGIASSDLSGYSVSGAGDFNGDGFDDVIIGAYRANPSGKNDAGQSYIIFGTNTPFTSFLELSSLTNNGNPNGIVINGIFAGDHSGISVSGAGDVNGDGFDDIIIGAPYADPNGNSSGQSYVIFGTNTPFTSPLELSSLNGTNGFIINGIAPFDLSCNSVSHAGDVNSDGFDDLVIGAYGASPNGGSSGQSYVIFGTNTPFTSPLELSSLNGTNGFIINGIYGGDFLGISTSGAGDINGDGFDDVIIGADRANPNSLDNAGQSYVIFGTNAPFISPLNLLNLNGVNGFVINGITNGDVSGRSVNGAGDVNGDDFDDLIIGAPLVDSNGQSDAGQGYIIFGKGTGFGSSLELSSLNGTNGFAMNGIAAGDFCGSSVSGAGDVNGDGVDDLIIGAHVADPNGFASGQSYLLLGRPNYRLTVSVATVMEGGASGTNVIATVSRKGDTNMPSTVTVFTMDGTATNLEDYIAFSNVVDFAIGQSTTNISITLVGDSVPEPTENFNIVLTDVPVGTTISGSPATVTILDDDTSPNTLTNLLLSPLSPAILTNTVLQFIATGQYSNGEVTNLTSQVNWTSTNIVVATINSTGLATALSVGQTLILADKDGITNQTILTVTNLAAGGGSTNIAFSANNYLTPEGAVGMTQSVILTVNRIGPTGAPIIFTYITTDGTATASNNDYIPVVPAQQVTMAGNITSTNLILSIIGDNAIEPNETFTVSLTVISGATLGNPSIATVVLNNDDQSIINGIDDFNNDGFSDILMQKKDKVTVLTSSSNAGYLVAGSITLPNKNNKVVAAQPINGTNYLALKIGPHSQVRGYTTTFAEAGTTTPGKLPKEAGSKIRASGDINNDGSLDLLTTKGSKANIVWGPTYSTFITINGIGDNSKLPGKMVGLYISNGFNVVVFQKASGISNIAKHW